MDVATIKKNIPSLGNKRSLKVSKFATAGLLLLSQLVILFVPFKEVLAAQVTIDAAVTTATTDHVILGASSVFVTDQIGYKFYVDGTTNNCVYSKTVNGGANWATAVVIDSDATCFGIVVWYDKWTPGDNGDYIHVLTMDTTDSDLWYNRLDTTNDERLLAATPVSTITNSGQTPTIAVGANNASITKGTDGTIYMALNDDNDRFVVECSSNCGTASSWTETGTTPMDLALDWSLLMPLSGGDILLINRDVSAEDIRSKVWDDSAGSWSGTWTTVDANALDITTYDPAVAATVDINTGVVSLAYINWDTGAAIGGTNDDIKTASYSATSSTWTTRTDVLTNTTMGLTGVAIGIDSNTGSRYVGYSGRTTSNQSGTTNVYWKSSTNNMTSWSVQNGPVNTLAEDIYGVDVNNSNYNRLGLSWYGASNDDMYIENVMADLTPVTEVSSRGFQESEISASTTDFYIGGTFVIDENSANKNVTSITVTENGTINGSTALDNIRLYYDLDTSNPYDCASESFSTIGGETAFGSADTDGFSGADGTSTFSDTQQITTTQSMCVYVVMDVLKSSSQGSTIEIEIASPDTDVVLSSGTAIPHYPIEISNPTYIKLGTDFKIQRGYFIMSTDTHTLTAGVDYDAPSSNTSAFMRITNTGYTGAGPDAGSGTRNADETTVYMTDPENITTSITFQRGTAAALNTRIAWEIIEYIGPAGGDNEIVVRQQEDLAYVSGNTTLTSGAVSGVVTDADIAVFITGQFNVNTGATVYNRGFSTAAWNAGGDTVTFTRGASGNVANLSYAVVEFTGPNWRIQRSENTYAGVTTETENITAVGSLSRTFLHVQKRFSVSTHANFGAEVWLSGIGQISYLLDAAATTVAGQVSVAWVIENIQTTGTPMVVTRSNGNFNTTGTSPQTNNITISALSDLSVTSLFVNNRADTTNNTWPEPILGARLISTTQYELWRSDITANINYRTEIVEWPTAERKIEQNYYNLYVDNNALTPTDAWPSGGTSIGENTEMTANDVPLALGDNVRIRMTLNISGSAQPASLDTFKLQFGERDVSCGAITSWFDIGDSSSTTALWRGVSNTPVDGTALSTDPPSNGDLLISTALGGNGVAGTYEEGNNTASNPFTAYPGNDVEYDWAIEHNGAEDKTSYCFRMIESDGTEFQDYNNYPVIRTVGYEPVLTNWRWYDDENNATPSTPLDNENIAPTNIANENAIKLRLVIREASGAANDDAKFAIQYSEYADFSQAVATATAATNCDGTTLWCYYNGAGGDNGVISSAVISDADSCVAGVGAGCGTYNESTSTVGTTVDHTALSSTEFEFTIQHAGARASAVYYFRLYDVVNGGFVALDTGASYPSSVTEGPQLTFSIGGLTSGTSVAGVTLDVTTTPTEIQFGSLTMDVSREAAQRFTINTNSTDGYQMLQYVTQQMTNTYGDVVPAFGATNATPAAWSSGCISIMTGCFGYHTTDGSLQGGSTRFAADDLYAAFSTTPEEVMYSSIFASDVYDIVYRMQVSPLQPAGDYETTLVYIAVPSF